MEQINDLLKEKEQLLQDILTITNTVDFTNDAEPLETYISIVEGRDVLINRLKEVDKKLNGADKTEGEKTNSILQSILDADIELRNKLEVHTEQLKESIKNINKTRNMRNYYQNELYYEKGGSLDLSN